MSLKKYTGYKKDIRSGEPIKATLLQWIKEQLFRIKVGRGLHLRATGNSLELSLDEYVLLRRGYSSFYYDQLPVLRVGDYVFLTSKDLVNQNSKIDNSNSSYLVSPYLGKSSEHHSTFMVDSTNYNGESLTITIYWLHQDTDTGNIRLSAYLDTYTDGSSIDDYVSPTGGGTRNISVSSSTSNLLYESEIYVNTPGFTSGAPTICNLYLTRATAGDSFDGNMYLLGIKVTLS